MFTCSECQKEFKKMQGLNIHSYRIHSGIIHKTVSWNKGLTKEDHPSIKQNGLTYSQRYREGKYQSKTIITESTSRKLSQSAKKNNLGGYRPGSGRGKGEYTTDSFNNVVYLQSSYEVILSKILNESKIIWSRPSPLPYTSDKVRNYYPDFYLNSYDIFIDTKNSYLQKIDAEKINLVRQQNNIKLYIFGKECLNIDYINNFLINHV